MRPRVGHIQFLNCLPLYHMLVRSGAVLAMDLYKDTPIALSKRLLCRKLDISPVPAIEYARHAEDLLLLPDLTVSSNGRVMSILLVSKVPVQELDGRSVALTNTSATSQILTKIILREKYSIAPHYFECPPDLPEMFREADAALLIGDDALRVCVRPKGFYLYDLGEEWKAFTGQAMVYAVLAVRNAYAEQHP
ncbi:MAG: menaquinone biosynthesis protein, partial [Pseudomonadota bacterium]